MKIDHIELKRARRRRFALAAALATALALSCSSDNWEEDTFTDGRDGKKYRSVVMGTQTWMAENLNYEAEGSRCYENKAENCKKCGRLYDWDMAMEACPEGWHLPDNDEWDKLYRFVDPDGLGYYESVAAGKFLKTKKGWIVDNGVDKYGFSAIPCGYSSSGGIYFSNFFGNSSWWSASEHSSVNTIAHYRYIGLTESASWSFEEKSYYLYSVRCVKDLTAP